MCRPDGKYQKHNRLRAATCTRYYRGAEWDIATCSRCQSPLSRKMEDLSLGSSSPSPTLTPKADLYSGPILGRRHIYPQLYQKVIAHRVSCSVAYLLAPFAEGLEPRLLGFESEPRARTCTHFCRAQGPPRNLNGAFPLCKGR